MHIKALQDTYLILYDTSSHNSKALRFMYVHAINCCEDKVHAMLHRYICMQIKCIYKLVWLHTFKDNLFDFLIPSKLESWKLA